jgi:SPP1 gp7 family putative phage head morphogenesis protein
MAVPILSEEEIERLIVQVYSGAINVENLPVNLYAIYVDRFAKAIDSVFTGYLTESERELRAELFENIQLFSGAKTFQEIKDMESLLTEDGMILDFAKFREKALKQFSLYNKTWLATELTFTTNSAIAGKQWTNIWEDKEIFPLLEYVTVGDGLVRDTHKVLDGVIRPVTDSFWNTYYPPWSWNCRCDTKKLEEGDITTLMNKIVVLPKIKKFFQNNVGKTGKIFNGFHPYFKEVPDRYKELAKRNFGLPFIQVTKKTKLDE